MLVAWVIVFVRMGYCVLCLGTVNGAAQALVHSVFAFLLLTILLALTAMAGRSQKKLADERIRVQRALARRVAAAKAAAAAEDR